MQGEIYHTIKASQMCAPFRRETGGWWRRSEVGGYQAAEAWGKRLAWKARCCEDPGRSRGLDLCWDTYWALVKGFLFIKNTILGKIHLASRLRNKEGRSHWCFFFILLHIKLWWILKGCFLCWIVYLQNKALSERMSRSQIAVDFVLIFWGSHSLHYCFEALPTMAGM